MLFKEQISRKPNLYPWTQQFIDAMWRGHWTPNEFNFTSDIQQFKIELTNEEQDIIKKTLSAIGQIEIAVKTFWGNLGKNLPHPSMSDLGYVMANVEVIHNLSYEKLLTVLGLEDIFEENLKIDVIQGRVKYLKKYLEKNYADQKKQFIYSLILFTLFVENVSLFSQFYIILWFNRYKNVLKDTAQQVQYTKNEELIHAQVGTKLIQVLRSEYPELFDEELKDKVIHEAKMAFQSESKIVDWMLGNYEGIRIDKDILKEYIKSRINESLKGIGFDEIYDIDENLYRDFEWMNEELYGNNATDFFHKRPVDYAKNHASFSEEDLF